MSRPPPGAFSQSLRRCRSRLSPGSPCLGFGDSSFPSFCGYAQRISTLAAAKGWPQLLDIAMVDRQSPQDFARWGKELGAALGLPLNLVHQPVSPAAVPLTLVSRRDFGAEVQAPSAILRFNVPKSSIWQRLTGAGFARFEAGDLLGVIPEGSTMPRFYSLASNAADGFLEIVVRRQPGGLCSGQLTALEPGQTAQAFLRPNPAFRVDEDSAAGNPCWSRIRNWSARRLHPGQCEATANAPVLRHAPCRKRLSLCRGAPAVARRGTPFSPCHRRFTRQAPTLCAGCTSGRS